MSQVKQKLSDQSLKKFQDLLRELFQFDCADLDFGIYRIMNYKRDAIEDFINDELPRAIKEELQRWGLADRTQTAEKLKDAHARVLKDLGKTAVDADGNLDERFRETPIGKEYLVFKAQADRGLRGEVLEANIFNHLYSFFSRYYEDGDYISKRRYSRRQRYSIPYNGEEVYLHWANSDQYYIKTAEHFHDYSYKAPNGVTVYFKLKAADIEQNNIKGDKRFFLPQSKEIVWNNKDQEIVIPFEYRPLTNQERINYGNKRQQDAIISATLEEFLKNLKIPPDALAALIRERRVDSNGRTVTFLEHHLRHYTRRNTSDFFIHKDLKGFLSRELDFYLKNELLNLDEMEAAGEDHVEGWFQTMRVVRSVAGQIISFLDQIESFQKMLWEKRKFVTETHYCIRVNIVDESFHSEIAACKAQWEEWRNLFGIDEEEPNLFNLSKDRTNKRIDYLKNHPTLVLDTKHFSQDFIDRLLATFDDLDGMTDGLLLHSENWQALNILEARYQENIKCAYIDPPYNTGNDGFIYKDRYQRSSWLSMISDRLVASMRLFSSDGCLFVSIDDNEVGTLTKLINSVFGNGQHVTNIAARLNPRGRTLDKFLAKNHEYILTFSLFSSENSINQIPKTGKALAEYSEHDDKGQYRALELRNRNPVFNRGNRPNLYYPIYTKLDGGPISLDKTEEFCIEILPVNSRGEDGCWTWGQNKLIRQQNEVFARQANTGAWRVYRKDRIGSEDLPTTKEKTIWTDNEINNENGKEILRSMFKSMDVTFPKAPGLIEKILRIGCNSNNTILDYFAGSGTTGHAVINFNRKNGGQRKFILVEMGEYFTTIMLPRIKKVMFSPEWKDGKPKCMATSEEVERSPRIVKYQHLESYEDTLNNIEFDNAAGQHALKFNDYLIQYMLQWETKGSATLLNVEKISCPFSYKLFTHSDGETRETVADIPETFNYLLGLWVRTQQVYNDGRRRYLVYRGKNREKSAVTVIWRETEGWGKADYLRDRDFVAKLELTTGADEIFVNGDSLIPNAQALEPLFKSRMFAGVGM